MALKLTRTPGQALTFTCPLGATTMKVTTTNGNARNGLHGQRVRFTSRNGARYDVMLPTGNALQRGTHRDELLSEARIELRAEARDRYGRPRSRRAAQLLDLFVACKADLLIIHGRREVGHHA